MGAEAKPTKRAVTPSTASSKRQTPDARGLGNFEVVSNQTTTEVSAVPVHSGMVPALTPLIKRRIEANRAAAQAKKAKVEATRVQAEVGLAQALPLTADQRQLVAAKRAAALDRRSEVAKKTKLACLSSLAQALHGATVPTTVDGVTVRSDVANSLANQNVVVSTRADVRPTDPLDCSEIEDMSDDDEVMNPVWFHKHVFQDAGGEESAEIATPPGCPRPRIRLTLKTRIKRVRCTTKSFCP